MKVLSDAPILYIDTSVIGGAYDNEFAQPSRKLLDYLEQGRVRFMISDLMVEEVDKAPVVVKEELMRILILPGTIQVFVDTEARTLAAHYIKAGVLTLKSLNDCLHIAVATTKGAEAIVSWNFKHIVNFNRIVGFHSVNSQSGYPLIEIISPPAINLEVL